LGWPWPVRMIVMQYAIHESNMPRSLRTRQAKVWVGDSVVDPATLEAQGLRAVFVLMLKDVYGEVSIVFAVPNKVNVTPRHLAECRQCALGWLLQWDMASDRSSRGKLTRATGQ